MTARFIPADYPAGRILLRSGAVEVDRYRRPVIRCTLPDGRDPASRLAAVTAGLAQLATDPSSRAMQADFVQQLNRQRALEGELSRTIRGLDGLTSARVHLVLPKRQLFEEQAEQPSAAVTIGVGGRAPSPDQVQAIQNLVSSAVPNLKPGRVTVVDQHAKTLSAGEDGFGASMAVLRVDGRVVAMEYSMHAGRHFHLWFPVYEQEVARWSPGIVATGLLLGVVLARHRVTAGLFWCRRDDFLTLGGFDESRISGEDVDFARRLRALGAARGQRFGTLRRGHIVTSCRKFDEFGDWYVVRNPGLVRRVLKGDPDPQVDRFYYGFPR